MSQSTCIFYLCIMAGLWEIELIEAVQLEAKNFSRELSMCGIQKDPHEVAGQLLTMINLSCQKQHLANLLERINKK